MKMVLATAILLLGELPLAEGNTAPVPKATLEVPACGATSSGGTCCFEAGSRCYPNDCSSQACSEYPAYWRTDGKPCGNET